mgnify:FL=1
MAKRKTIRVNPLDPLVPDTDTMTRQTGKSAASAKARSTGPAADVTQTTTSPDLPRVKESDAPAPATQAAQPPSPVDLFSRVQSLEKQNEYIWWLVSGAILLAVLL